jgi:hypothetical protein
MPSRFKPVDMSSTKTVFLSGLGLTEQCSTCPMCQRELFKLEALSPDLLQSLPEWLRESLRLLREQQDS